MLITRSDIATPAVLPKRQHSGWGGGAAEGGSRVACSSLPAPPPRHAPIASRGGERGSIDPRCRASYLVAILIATSSGRRDFRREPESPLSTSSGSASRERESDLLARKARFVASPYRRFANCTVCADFCRCYIVI